MAKEGEIFLLPRRSTRKRAAAQITEQSRVGKLACQRGGEGCSRERCDIIATHARSAAVPAARLAVSRVQIKAEKQTHFQYEKLASFCLHQYGRLFRVFRSFLFGGEGEICLLLRRSTRKRAAAQITEQSRVGKLACQRGGEGCSRERCDIIATHARSAAAPAARLAVSRVQIKAQPQFRHKGLAVFDFLCYNNGIN